MSQNHPHDNIYNILSKLEALKPTPQETHDAIVKSIYESVEARGSITSGVSAVETKLKQQFAEGAKPDFLDLNKDGNKTEPMKKAAADKAAKTAKKDVADEGNVVSGALADKSIPVGDKIPGTNLKKNKQIEVEEAFNPNSVDAQQARDSKAHHHAELKKKADAGDADAQKRLDMIKKRRDADVKNFNDKMDYMEECAMCAEGTCTEHVVAEGDGDEAYVACIVQFNRSGRAMVQRTKPISHERAEEVIRNALAKNTFVHPPFMTIYPASAGKLDGSTIMAQFPDMSQKGLEEGQLEEANIQPTGAMSRSHIGNLSNPVTNSVVHPSSGKEIGLITQQPTGEYYAHPSSTGLAHSQGATFATKDEAHQFIRNAHAKAIKNGTLSDKWQKKQPLPQFAKGQQGVAEGFPTVADAKADHEKKEKEKGTGKFEKKTNPKSGGIEYTRKSSTYDNGGKKSVKESMSAVQSRFLMEANLKRMAEEHGETLEEMMAKMSEDMKHYRDTGECSAFLRDCMDMHGHNKKLEMEEAMNRPELPDPWMGVKDAPHPAKPSFASRVTGTAKSFGQKALSTLGHPSDEEMLKDLERKAMDEELDQLAELAGLKVTKRAMPEATVKVDTPDEEPVNAPKERYATMKQAPNVLGVGDGDIAGGDHPNHGGPGDNPLAPDLRKPRSVHPVKTLEAYINAEYESIKKAK